MARYLITMEYRGTSFHGFQKQPGLPTIQGSLESVLLALTGQEIRVPGAGRTDTGAHAFGQTAAFDLPHEVDPPKTIISLNALLPKGITITSMMQVWDGFDPRRNAEWREYRYFILNRSAPSALLDEFTYHHPGSLDIDLMNKACAACPGEHDFSAFRSKSQDESSVRTVLACEVREIMPGMLSLLVRADSFLYRMVRILGGAVVAVGNGKMEPEDFIGYLDSGAAKPCAEPLPARGLFLWRVSYPPETLSREPGQET